VSRLLWAVGYHQPPVYYVPHGWRLNGAPNWVHGAFGPQGHARFRPDLPNQDVAGEWSWYDNPFVGTRPFKGLILANLIVGNWDFKTSNNRIYEIDPPVGDTSRWFVVRDLGASLGKEVVRTPRWLFWRALRGSKNDPDDFAETGFVRRAAGDLVEPEHDTMDRALFEGMTAADVKWICGLFSRLSDQQWRDAFRAAGYNNDDGDRFIAKLKEKIAQGMRL
jgi:hypothetical protein